MRSSASDIASVSGSQPHWHHDVLGTRSPGGPDETAAVSIGKPEHDLSGVYRRERVEEIGDIEADFHFLALVGHFDLVLGLFLFGVMCLDRDEIRLQTDANSPILLIRENRRTLQRLAQPFAIGFDLFRGG